MKNTGCSLSPTPVYFYVQKESQLGGILLGNFGLIRGSGDFKIILDTENIQNSGYHLDKVKGIYIPLTENMMLVSQWDDDEFLLNNFVDLTDAKPAASDSAREIPSDDSSENPQNTTTAEKTPLLQAAEDSTPVQKNKHAVPEQETHDSLPAPETVPSPPERKEKPASQEVKNHIPQQDTKSSSTQDTKSPSLQNTEIPPARPTDALKAVEALPRTTERTAGFHTIPKKETYSGIPGTEQSNQHSQADVPEDWDLRWRFILENYPVMTPFAGDEHTLCVRMELKDLRQLPKQFWYFGNNSFLLHGFFNYRYFILGMTEEFGIKKWFIGVPGVFQNPERVMAALFGFPEFRSEKPSHINTGKFGYWYRYLNELSEPVEKDKPDSPK